MAAAEAVPGAITADGLLGGVDFWPWRRRDALIIHRRDAETLRKQKEFEER